MSDPGNLIIASARPGERNCEEGARVVVGRRVALVVGARVALGRRVVVARVVVGRRVAMVVGARVAVGRRVVGARVVVGRRVAMVVGVRAVVGGRVLDGARVACVGSDDEVDGSTSMFWSKVVFGLTEAARKALTSSRSRSSP